MVGIKRRRRVEGWALDVSETDAQVGRSTLRQRLAESNKLWVVCVAVVLVLTAGLIRFANTEQSSSNGHQIRPAGADAGSPDDAAHREFARQFLAERSGNPTVLDARFVSADRFQITVPSSLRRDDIEFLAKFAGLKIVHDFRFRPVVEVYSKGSTKRPELVATAQWEPKKFGFVVKSPRK